MWVKCTAVVVLLLASSVDGFVSPGEFDWVTGWMCYPSFLQVIFFGAEPPAERPRIPEMRTFIGTYSYDVGTCPMELCYSKSYMAYACPRDGHFRRETVSRMADLGPFGQQQYEYVTRCVCRKDSGVEIIVKTVDSATEERLPQMRILFDAEEMGRTNDQGEFSSTVANSIRVLTITAFDDLAEIHLDTVKIIDIPEGLPGPLVVTLHMIKKADPIEIESASETTLSVSDNPTNLETGNALIVIQPNSFIRPSGSQYDGTVRVSLTFLDPNTGSEEPIPGRFLVAGTLENLISDGILSLEFKDTNGNDLILVTQVKIIVREGMQLWNLDTDSGFWELISNGFKRRRRQVTLTDEYLINIENRKWVNIDKIPGAPRCYFKGRIFDETSGAEITSSATASFQPHIVAFTNQNQRLWLYASPTNSPANTCFEVRCPDVSDPNDALTGFINMKSTELVDIGGVNVPYVSDLVPKDLGDYIATVQTRLSTVQYAIAPNGLDIFVNFVSNVAGPFFTDLATCEATTATQPALHFFKSAPPSYEPVPDGTNICTASISFEDNWNFYNYTMSLTDLPTMSAISVWEQDGQRYYYTSTVQLEEFTEDGAYFVFACLQYRCSDGIDLTTVYLDIVVPDITYYYNYTNQDGEIIETNYTSPAFYCYGECEGELCYGREGNPVKRGVGEGSFADGSFIAPVGPTPDGPDFYDSEFADCADRTEEDEFAYTFFCNSREEGNENGGGF